MANRPIPKQLRWFLFIAGVGTLVSSGIYLGTAQVMEDSLSRLLRALMFLLLGLFFLLMYGENRSDRGSE